MRTWNPLWLDPIDAGAPADYKASIRRQIMASVNFVEAHNFKPNYFKRELKNAPPGKVLIIASWEEIYRAIDDITGQWFKAIEEAASQGDPGAVPTAFMMTKAIACGNYVQRYGWDSFNQFMASPHEDDNERSH